MTEEMRKLLQDPETTEFQLRDLDVPWFDKWEDLQEFCEILFANQNNGYGKTVYCMSLAATAMFYFASNQVGSSGFQASCADMDVLARTRGLKCGFRILNYENLLYPQYLNKEHFPSMDDLMEDCLETLAKHARELLTKRESQAHPYIIAHWKSIVERFDKRSKDTTQSS